MSTSRWRGFTTTMQTPHDLLAKMERDYARMLAAPGDPDPVFDFFVAAEAMPDWRYPNDPAARKVVRSHDPGKTVSHFASGAKHFEATAPQHTSIAGVETEPDYGTAVLGRARLGEMVLGSGGRPALMVTTTGGRRYEASELARLVIAYWKTELGPGGMHDVSKP